MTGMNAPESMSCDSCPLTAGIERREFVRDAIARSLGVLVAMALLPASAAALPVREVHGRGARAAKTYPLPPTDGVSIDREESVIIARAGDRAYAFSLACPHQNTALRWDERNRRFQCPKHKSRYQPDGVFIDGRATRGLDRFAVTRDAASLVVDLDRLYREDKHSAEWAAAFVTVGSEK